MIEGDYWLKTWQINPAPASDAEGGGGGGTHTYQLINAASR